MDEIHVARQLVSLARKLASSKTHSFLSAFAHAAKEAKCFDILPGDLECKRSIAKNSDGGDIAGYMVRGEYSEKSDGSIWYEVNIWVGVVGIDGMDQSQDEAASGTIPADMSEQEMVKFLDKGIFLPAEKAAVQFMRKYGRELKELVPDLRVGGS